MSEDRYKKFGDMARDMPGQDTVETAEVSPKPPPKKTENKINYESQIIQDEGYRRDPYVDTRGYMTGGIGHKFTEEDYQNFKPEWSDKQKDAYWAARFEEDLSYAKQAAMDIMDKKGIEYNERYEAVLSNMVFNLGKTGVENFPNFLSALSKDNIDEAIKEMKTSSDGSKPSDWYSQVPNRVDRLAKILQGA